VICCVVMGVGSWGIVFVLLWSCIMVCCCVRWEFVCCCACVRLRVSDFVVVCLVVYGVV